MIYESKKSEFYTSIDFMPIYNYFECASGNLCFMFVSNKSVITEHIIKTFELIQEQFAERMNYNSMKLIREKMYRILKLRLRVERITNYLVLLAIKEDSDVIEWLLNEGFKYNSNERLFSLKQIQGEVTNLKNKISEIENELQASSTENKDINIFDIIAKIEKSMSIAIDPHKLTTAQFISYIKDLKNGK